MGLQIGEIVPRKEISLADLAGKTIAVDAFNTIYQFLTTIRQPDGTPLMDKKGRITSHISGLFYRNMNLLTQGIKLIYVFDGKSPELKQPTHLAREEIKKKAAAQYEEAARAGRKEEMGKYARQLSFLDEEMIEESKQLLEALGIPCVQAPAEGEAQAAFMCKNEKEIYAVASQDYDALLFAAPKLVRNLTLARRRKLASGATIPVNPELIQLDNVLNTLQINHDQLICLGIITGTDYNPKGARGYGPKKALAFVRQYKQPAIIFNKLEKEFEKQGQQLDFDWKEIFSLFKKPEVAPYELAKRELNKKKVFKLLLEHDFSHERIESAFKKLEASKKELGQAKLKSWFSSM